MLQPLAMLLLLLAAVVAFVLLMIFVVVPLFKGIAWIIGSIFKGIGMFFAHIGEYVIGTCQDVVRFVGAIPPMIVLCLLCVLNIVIGRWSAAGHFANSFRREVGVAVACLYRVALKRPLKLVLLHGLLEGLEQRLPEAMQHAPGADAPSRRSGTFDGYTITGSLRGGGSGAKLYVAEPAPDKRRAVPAMPDRVVIKSFALTDGSSLPQIVRESRALEAARKLGLVLDHQMEPHRFYYVMPYHPGDHLGIITRQLHAVSDVDGLSDDQLDEATAYVEDLLHTLHTYHDYGLWHKDVKPENIIVHDNRAHLVDLGLVTSLTSGMTLTTHGTEYFRDPELVRQALRGVKVHQVNGAKFDVYAAGAVLYFMIENTFPAHGGLSRIQKRCPEALRWIVRRAMTEYDKRYDSAAMMLEDLRMVRDADDPFAIKPASLPSMRNGAEAAEDDHDARQDDDTTVVSAARSPVPPRAAAGTAGAAGAAGAAESDAGVGAAGARPRDGQRDRRPSGGSRLRRPNIRVTNWWTGAFVVEDEDDRSGGRQARRQSRPDRDGLGVGRDELRRHVGAVVDDSQRIAEDARRQAGRAVRSARDQLTSARKRVKDRQRRAAAKRIEMAPATSMSIGATLGFFVLFGLVMWIVLAPNLRDAARPMAGSVDGAGDAVTATPAGSSALPGMAPLPPMPPASPARSGPPVPQMPSVAAHWTVPSFAMNADNPILVINDHPAVADSRVKREIEVNLDALTARGVVVIEDDDAEVAFRQLLPRWEIDADGYTVEMLNDTLDAFELGGILRIRRNTRDDDRYTTSVMWISRSGESARTSGD